MKDWWPRAEERPPRLRHLSFLNGLIFNPVMDILPRVFLLWRACRRDCREATKIYVQRRPLLRRCPTLMSDYRAPPCFMQGARGMWASCRSVHFFISWKTPAYVQNLDSPLSYLQPHKHTIHPPLVRCFSRGFLMRNVMVVQNEVGHEPWCVLSKPKI